MQYNTVVSGAMKLLNLLEDFNSPDSPGAKGALVEGFGILLRCLYPVVPHIAHQLWAEMGYAVHYGDMLDAPWPRIDEGALAQDEVELMLQINGKLRGSMLVATSASKEAIERQALAHELVQKLAAGGAIKRVIIVPGRLVNVVL